MPTDSARVVHHGEHVGEPAAFLADQVAHRAAVVAERHHAGRAGMDAELVLERHAAQVVALAGLAVGADQELRHDEQRDAAHAGRRIGRARQHQVHDVLGHVVLAVGDEDLLAGDQVVVALLDRAALELGEVRAGLRLGEVHGAGPFARDHLGQVGRLSARPSRDDGWRRSRPGSAAAPGRSPCWPPATSPARWRQAATACPGRRTRDRRAASSSRRRRIPCRCRQSPARVRTTPFSSLAPTLSPSRLSGARPLPASLAASSSTASIVSSVACS